MEREKGGAGTPFPSLKRGEKKSGEGEEGVFFRFVIVCGLGIRFFWELEGIGPTMTKGWIDTDTPFFDTDTLAI